MKPDWQPLGRLTVNERRLLRVHGRSVVAVALFYSAMAAVLWKLGHNRVDGEVLAWALVLLWSLMLPYLAMIERGLTRAWQEPTLSFPAGIVLAAMLLLTAVHTTDGRLAVMLLYFPLLLLLSFRLEPRALGLLSVVVSAAYGLALLGLYQYRDAQLELASALLQWLAFVAVSACFTITGGGVNALRRTLGRHNRELARMVRQSRELAIRDDLTGLFNRRHIVEVLDYQKSLADRHHYPFAVCYLDMDHFKAINDRYGHQWGDQVLRAFADHAAALLREGDYLARLGGEEFLMVLPQSNEAGALRVVERLRQQWANAGFDHMGGPATVTLSAGVAGYQPGETVEALLARADHGLYLAKSHGRNQVRTG